MKITELKVPLAEEIKTAGKEFVDRATDLSKGVARNVRRLRNSAEDAAEETRHQIKMHPVAAVATAAGVGLALGIMAGWFIGSRHRFD